MKVTVLLKKDHEVVNNLFSRYKKAGARSQNGKKEMLDEIRKEISLHSQMELDIFYPALQNTASTRAVELTAAAIKEHQEVENLLDELSNMNPQDNKFDTKMTALMDQISDHIRFEEDEIFDEARRNFSEPRLEELGLEMEDRRRIITQIAA